MTERDTTTDIDAVLASRRQIASIWGIDDVQDIRPDLDEAQAWHVLQQVSRNEYAGTNINWEEIGAVADELYPEPPEAQE